MERRFAVADDVAAICFVFVAVFFVFLECGSAVTGALGPECFDFVDVVVVGCFECKSTFACAVDCFDFVVVVFVDCLDCCSDVADAVAADSFDFAAFVVVVVVFGCLECGSAVADFLGAFVAVVVEFLDFGSAVSCAVAAESFDFFVDVGCFECGSDVADGFDANGFDFDASCTIRKNTN